MRVVVVGARSKPRALGCVIGSVGSRGYASITADTVAVRSRAGRSIGPGVPSPKSLGGAGTINRVDGRSGGVLNDCVDGRGGGTLASDSVGSRTPLLLGIDADCHAGSSAAFSSSTASHAASCRAPAAIAARVHAAAMSAAVPRSLGSRDSAVATASTISTGTSGFIRSIRGGSVRRTASRIALTSWPRYSARPVNSSHAMMPSANTSACAVGGSPSVCSGAM